MDFGKIFNAVKLPIIIMVVLSLISTGLGYLVLQSTDFSSIAGIQAATSSLLQTVGILLGLVMLGVVVWAGYRTAKMVQGSAVEGGVGAAVA